MICAHCEHFSLGRKHDPDERHTKLMASLGMGRCAKEAELSPTVIKAGLSSIFKFALHDKKCGIAKPAANMAAREKWAAQFIEKQKG